MKEGKFWDIIKNRLLLDHLERIENKLGSGMPDVHTFHKGLTVWIELKSEAKYPSKIAFQKGQPIWLTNYWRTGGTALVALRSLEDDMIFFWRGADAFELDKPGGCDRVKPVIMFKNTQENWRVLSARWLDFRNDRFMVPD